MTFLYGFILGFFTAGVMLNKKFRAGVWAMLRGLGRGFMSFRKWALTHGPYAESAKRKKEK